MNRLDGVLHRPVELAALIGHFGPLNKSCYATRLQLIAALASTRAKCTQSQSTSTTISIDTLDNLCYYSLRILENHLSNPPVSSPSARFPLCSWSISSRPSA